MAKIRGGALAGQMSGALAGQVFSHNRYGAYVRNRSIPVTSQTPYALQAKARMTMASQAWQGLDAAVQKAWEAWANVNLVSDSFGEPQALSGQAAFVRLGINKLIMSEALPTTPPVVAAPEPLITLTGTYDIGVGDFAIAFTPTPLGATERLWSWVAVVDSLGRNYVKNLLKLVDISAAALATGYDLQAAIEARFGSLSVGQRVRIECQVADEDTGLVSRRVGTFGTVVTT